MRSTPYQFTDKTTAATPAAEPKLNERSFESSVIRDLSAEIARPIKPTVTVENEPKPIQEQKNEPKNTETPTTENTEAPKPAGTATLNEDFQKYKEKFQADATKAIEDPKRAAATTVRFFNFIRMVGYPFLMKWAAFEEQEKAVLDATLAKVFEAEKNKTTETRDKVIADFTILEKRVYEKWQGLEAHKKNIAYTEAEINFLVDVGYMKMQEIKFIKWLMQNEFAMAILFIEGRRIAPVVTARMGLGFVDLPSFL
jgi:hypothetical protein